MAARFQGGLREKIVFSLLIVLVFSFACSGWLSFERQKMQLQTDNRNQTQNIARYMAHAIGRYSGDDLVTAADLVAEAVITEDAAYAALYNQSGGVEAEAGRQQSAQPWQTSAHAVVRDGQAVGIVQIQFSTQRYQAQLAALAYHLGWNALFTAVMIAGLTFLMLTRTVVRPLAEIRRRLTENEDAVLDDYHEDEDDFTAIVQQFRGFRRIYARAKDNFEQQMAQMRVRVEQMQQHLHERNREIEQARLDLKSTELHDPLTGLYNRPHFDVTLAKQFEVNPAQAPRVSLLLLEIDHFRSINDNLGTHAGNRLLQQTAELIKASKAACDTLFRVSGKTFALICPNMNDEKALVLASYIRNKIGSHEFHVDEHVISICVNAGVASYPGSAGCSGASDLHKCAEVALQYSREHGGNRATHFDHIMQNVKNPYPAWTPPYEKQSLM